MDRWAYRQRVFAVECFVRSNSVVDMQRAFRREFGTHAGGTTSHNSSVGEIMARNWLCARKETWEMENNGYAWKHRALENHPIEKSKSFCKKTCHVEFCPEFSTPN
jgi:hypothetical protein